MDVSISIVNYNTKDLVIKCITSILKYTKGIRCEIIVVDNGSNDGATHAIKKLFPKVTVIINNRNNYFSKANNPALKIAKGKYFLILNSDTWFVENSIKKMVDYLEKHKNVGACEGLEMYKNGEIINTGSLFSSPIIDFFELSLLGKYIKSRRLIQEYRINHRSRQETFPIDIGCDAFLMVRKKILDRINGYDEDLMLYYTENDLCFRIKELGYEIVHLGNVLIMHHVSESVKKIGWKKMDIYYKDLLCYYKKRGYAISGFLLYLLLKSEEVLLKVRESLS